MKGVSLFLFLVLSCAVTFAQEQEMMIKQIEIIGNQKMNTQALRSKLNLKEGYLFSPEAVQKEIKNFYQLGLFQQVTAETTPFEGGVSIRFAVDEEPTLSEIHFEGNEAIKAEALADKLTLKTQRPLNRTAMRNDLKAIVAHYQKEGYPDATVVPIFHSISDVESALTFLITENKKAAVRKIKFDGLSVFSEQEIKRELLTQEYAWYRIFNSEQEHYQVQMLEADRERISALYLNHGYLQVQVGQPAVTFNEDQKSIEILFPISEGKPFTLEKVSVEGNAVIASDLLKSATENRAQTRFSKATVEKDIQKIKDLYGERGYLFVNVVPQIVSNIESGTVALTFVITEGSPHKIRNIHIHGNDKTRDKVIRREVRQNEQEIVNTKLLKRSFQRIHNLNFFEDVQIAPQRVGEGILDLDIAVQEKSTGTLSLGGGYSSVDGFVGQFEVNQGNLFGRGHLLRASAEFGGKRTAYNLTFREPYLFDSTFSLQSDVFNRSREFTNYREKRKGGDLIFGKSFGEHLHHSVMYTLETLSLSGVTSTAPAFIQAQSVLGETVTSAVGFTLTKDTRDFAFDPKEGARHSLSLEYAGTFLGGDNAYYTAVFDSGRYFRAWRDEVFSLHSRIGFADGIAGKSLPVGERFFVGGINTVRGFGFGKAGPITNGVISGGNKELYFNAEYLIPLTKEGGLKWVFFYDIGAAFDDGQSFSRSDFRQGAGVGIRFLVPMLGMIRCEWGWNLAPKPEEDQMKFEFSIGALF